MPVSLSYDIPDTQEASYTPVRHLCAVKNDAVGCTYTVHDLVPPVSRHDGYIDSLQPSHGFHSCTAGKKPPLYRPYMWTLS